MNETEAKKNLIRWQRREKRVQKRWPAEHSLTRNRLHNPQPTPVALIAPPPPVLLR